MFDHRSTSSTAAAAIAAGVHWIAVRGADDHRDAKRATAALEAHIGVRAGALVDIDGAATQGRGGIRAWGGPVVLRWFSGVSRASRVS
ncbi:MAG TPA: hypothetical protein VGN19_10475, partial [Pedococcus sp.]|nr:hypothetical protein [Pedococcus sp.]